MNSKRVKRRVAFRIHQIPREVFESIQPPAHPVPDDPLHRYGEAMIGAYDCSCEPPFLKVFDPLAPGSPNPKARSGSSALESTSNSSALESESNSSFVPRRVLAGIVLEY